jgi:precorrin-4 methylase
VTKGRVLFVGCGPGAADLLTVRAARAMARADVVIWSPSLLDEDVVLEHTRQDAELLAWPPATERDVLAVYDRAREEELEVVRLKGGDPGLFGALEPELGDARARGLAVEVVPGVSAASAAAAALACELAVPGVPALITDVAGLESVASGVRVAVFMAGQRSDPDHIAEALAARGLGVDTSCAVALGITRASETLVRCRLDELSETLTDLGGGAPTTVVAVPGAAWRGLGDDYT